MTGLVTPEIATIFATIRIAQAAAKYLQLLKEMGKLEMIISVYRILRSAPPERKAAERRQRSLHIPIGHLN